MVLYKNMLVLLTILSFPAQANAFEDAGVLESATETLDETPTLRGITFDRTITQTGFSFYQEFTRLWQADAIAEQHSLTIRETPTARHGSIIWIEEGSILLHRLNIGLRNRNVTEKVEESLRIMQKKLINLNNNTF